MPRANQCNDHRGDPFRLEFLIESSELIASISVGSLGESRCFHVRNDVYAGLRATNFDLPDMNPHLDTPAHIRETCFLIECRFAIPFTPISTPPFGLILQLVR